jgi:hypothetical protein
MRARHICLLLTIFIIVAGLVLGLVRPKPILALEEFTKKLEAKYTVQENGETNILYEISLQNNLSTVYAKEYVLELNSTDISNVKVTDSENESLPFNVTPGTNTTTIRVQFPEDRRVIGRDQIQSFSLEFVSTDSASRYGQVLEVTIPKLANPADFSSYQVSVLVPSEFGEPSLVEPGQYTFNQAPEIGLVKFSNVGQEQGISIIFGDSQTYDLALKYHLANTSQNIGVVQVALPPDTAWQRMQYERIEPAPDLIRQDIDGNWIAEFRLAGQAETTVEVNAKATVFARPLADFTVESPLRTGARQAWWSHQEQGQNYLEPTEAWPVSAPVIQQLSDTYQSPKSIYDYTVDTLTYNYRRFEQPDALDRLGAVRALEDPANAVCLEFTDVFVTLARAAGLPARRLTGYAVTQNSQLRPLSLVADVLHAWPEYYDAQRRLWVPVDPTWADTTGGVDYFNKLDLRHLVFAIQGQNDTRPLPAGMYKIAGQSAKDVEVTLAEGTPSFTPNLEISKKPSLLPQFGLPTKETIVIRNNSGVAAYNKEVAFGLDGPVELLSEPVQTIPALLPYQEQELTVDLSGQNWWTADQAQLRILLDDQTETYTITARQAVDPRWRKPWVLGGIVILLSAGAGGILVFVLHRAGFVRR